MERASDSHEPLCFGAGLFFEADDYGPDFMPASRDWPKNPDDCVALFNRYGDLQQKAFQYAHRLGIKTCVGTEIPLGVPQALKTRIESKGLRADDPAVIRRLYEGTFLRLSRKMPIDYFWLWTPEAGVDTPDWKMVTKANFAQIFRWSRRLPLQFVRLFN